MTDSTNQSNENFIDPSVEVNVNTDCLPILADNTDITTKHRDTITADDEYVIDEENDVHNISVVDIGNLPSLSGDTLPMIEPCDTTKLSDKFDVGSNHGVEDTCMADTKEIENIDEDQYSMGFCDVSSLLITGTSLVLYLVDVGTDIELTIEYKSKGLMGYFWSTLACIVIPHMLLAITDLSMLWEDRKIMRAYMRQEKQDEEQRAAYNGDGEEVEMMQIGDAHIEGKAETEVANQSTESEDLKDLKCEPGSRKEGCLLGCCVSVEFTKDTRLYVLRAVLGLMGLGVIIRKLQRLYYKFKSQTERRCEWKQWYDAKMLEAQRDSSNLAFICAFTENCPQSLLQIYIFVQNPVPLYESIGRSIITSVINLPLAYANYYRATRRQPKDEGSSSIREDVDDVAFLFYYLGLLGAIIVRVLSIGLFMGTVSYKYGFVVLGAHFLGHVIFIHFYQKPPFSGLAIAEISCSTHFSVAVQTLLYALVNVFLFVDLNDRTRKQWRIIANNVVLYLQNFTFLILSFTLVRNGHVDIYALVAGLGCLMHLIFLSNYYKFLHPTVGICFKCGDQPEVRVSSAEKHVDVDGADIGLMGVPN